MSEALIGSNHVSLGASQGQLTPLHVILVLKDEVTDPAGVLLPPEKGAPGESPAPSSPFLREVPPATVGSGLWN